MNSMSCHVRKMGFTLIELLAVIAVISVLAAILIPVAGRIRVSSAKARDTAQLRQYGVGVLLYSTVNTTITAADLFDETVMGEYVGDEVGFDQVLSSDIWAQEYGLNVADRPRSYTINSTLFRQDSNPDSPGHAIIGTEVHRIQAEHDRPLFFTGILQANRNRAYNWGGAQHLNPIYSGQVRTSPGDVDFGQYASFPVLTLRVSGAVELIDYAKRNDASWWLRDHLK